MHPSESELDNVLIHQAGAIRELVRDNCLEQAIERLSILKELWDTCGYTYKCREIMESIRNILRDGMHEGQWKQKEKASKLYRSTYLIIP